MDYEKLHKDTITKLQEMVNSGKITVETARGICVDFVPESEDERIRKELLSWLKRTDGQTLPIDRYNVAVAWLEKKGEQKSLDDIAKEVTKDKDAAISFLKSTGIINENGELADEYKIEQGEQKPTEWSEEDERIRIETLELLETANHPNKMRSNGKPLDFTENINWLKSLKDRVQPQPKQEWSEEDENVISLILSICNDFLESFKISPASTRVVKEDVDKIENWLKSLRPQNRWKPSDEQMQALSNAGNSFRPFEEGHKVLWSLYNDLKKLKG